MLAAASDVLDVHSLLPEASGKSAGYVTAENFSDRLPMFSTSTVFGLSALVEFIFVVSKCNDGASARSIFVTCSLKVSATYRLPDPSRVTPLGTSSPVLTVVWLPLGVSSYTVSVAESVM